MNKQLDNVSSMTNRETPGFEDRFEARVPPLRRLSDSPVSPSFQRDDRR
jgi:hypothetical protein